MAGGVSRQNPGGLLASTVPDVLVPLAFLTQILPAIDSIEELQVTIALLRIVPASGGYGSPVDARTLLRDPVLRGALRVSGSPREPDRRIHQGIDLAVARGTLLAFSASSGRSSRDWYYVNTPENRTSLALVAEGSLPPPRATWIDDDVPEIIIERPNVFRLYEQNIGPLTPILADQISAAIARYPEDWLADAIGEAVTYNRRSWRYVDRILQNWVERGRPDDSP